MNDHLGTIKNVTVSGCHSKRYNCNQLGLYPNPTNLIIEPSQIMIVDHLRKCRVAIEATTAAEMMRVNQGGAIRPENSSDNQGSAIRPENSSQEGFNLKPQAIKTTTLAQTVKVSQGRVIRLKNGSQDRFKPWRPWP